MHQENTRPQNKILSRAGVIAVILAAAVVTGLSFRFMANIVRDKIVAANVRSMEELALHDQNSIRNSIDLRFESMESLAGKIGERTYANLKALVSDLPAIARSIQSADEASLLDSEGTQYSSNGLVKKESYLAGLCEGRTERFIMRLNTEARFDESRKEVILAAVPVNCTVDGHKIEWLAARFPITTLEREMKIESYNGQGYSSVIDADGGYIIKNSRSKNYLERENFFEDLSGAKFKGYAGVDELRAATAAAAADTGAIPVVYTMDGREYIMVITAFDFTDWYFVTTVPAAVFAKQTSDITTLYIILLGALALALAAAAFAYIRQRRRKAELERAEQEKQDAAMRSIIAQYSSEYDAVYTAKLDDGKYTAVTEHEGFRTGHNAATIDDLLAENTVRYIHPDDRERIARDVSGVEHVKEDYAAGESRTFEYRRLAGEEYEWFRLTLNRISEELLLVGIKNCHEEITQKIADDTLLGEYDAIYAVNLDKNLIRPARSSRVSDVGAIRKKTDYTALAASFAETVAPQYRQDWLNFSDPKYMKSYMANDDHREYIYELPGTDRVMRRLAVDVLERENGEARIVLLSFTGIDDERANAIRLHRQLAEQTVKLEEALEKAETANRAKSTFLFNMSHDIRTPMNAITGFTNMALKHLNEPEKVRDCLEKTQKSGSMLLSLINSVLEVSRIESGSAVLEEQHGDVYYSFVNLESTMKELAATKDIGLSFEFGDVTDRYVYADFSRCMRIFVNVISNAIKYTPEGGTVKVRCEQLGKAEGGRAKYKYTFADNGIGMSEEFIGRIFEQFSRENSSTISGIQGSGLGMNVVKSFVDLMGGTVDVQSTQGIGTTVTVILPFRLQEEAKYTDPVTGEVVDTEETSARQDASFCGRRALLVEDNELNREIAAEILEDEDIIVEEAEDGTDAVCMLRDMGPDYYDFILMDIQMPKMNGYDATKVIRAMYPDARIPIIAVSANAFDEDRKASKEAGMDGHVAKPINIKELFSALAEFL